MSGTTAWRKLFEQVASDLLDMGGDICEESEKQYRIAMNRIEQDIAAWYIRFAKDNHISYAEAKKILTADELEEFQWTVDEYIARGEAGVVDEKWLRQLKNASTRVHISRLEMLKIQIRQHLELLYHDQIERISAGMKQVYEQGYYHTIYEIQKGIGVGTSLVALDTRRIENLLQKSWTNDGKNFKTRSQDAKYGLYNSLHKILIQAAIRGDGVRAVVEEASKKMNGMTSAAFRLITTETAFFASKGQYDGYREIGVERYEIVATLDRKTSPTCRKMDGEIFALSDFQPSVTAPPFHSRCRSCTAPYIPDDDSLRAARDREDEYILVPADMKYTEWYEKVVQKGEK